MSAISIILVPINIIMYLLLTVCTSKFNRSLKHTTLLEKYPTFFFLENLVDFNEAHLHEATLNLHTHTWIFPPPVNSVS